MSPECSPRLAGARSTEGWPTTWSSAGVCPQVLTWRQRPPHPRAFHTRAQQKQSHCGGGEGIPGSKVQSAFAAVLGSLVPSSTPWSDHQSCWPKASPGGGRARPGGPAASTQREWSAALNRPAGGFGAQRFQRHRGRGLSLMPAAKVQSGSSAVEGAAGPHRRPDACQLQPWAPGAETPSLGPGRWPGLSPLYRDGSGVLLHVATWAGNVGSHAGDRLEGRSTGAGRGV